MATSGTYTDTQNNLSIVSQALRKIGRLGDFETLADTDARYTKSLPVLQSVCKHLAAKGMPLWAIAESTIDLSNFTSMDGITIGLSGATITQVAPLKIIQCILRDTLNDLDTPMDIYTQDAYNRIADKTAEGTPLFYTYYPRGTADTTKGTLKVWPLPDDTWQTTLSGQLLIRYQRPFQDVGTSTQELDFPKEWQLAVVYLLAVTMAPDYGVDMNQRNQLKADAKDFISEAESFGTEEGSLYLQPRIKQ